MISIVFKIIKKLFKYIFKPLLVISILWASYLFIYGNFHKVDKDIYRSAQLFSFNISYYIEKNQIKSILNLRGESEDKWYKDEVFVSKKYNIKHIDYGIGSRRMITQKEMDTIVSLIKDAPKPLLIHCKAGADRTSLAVALYKYTIKNQNKSDAQKDISILYGHFPWLGSETVAMDKSFQEYIK